jgi:NAD(P)-dependent dehydrogenase (short-subunit alcohol dehydrogenase family)
MGARKLEGKVAIITGGDSGIGRSIAIAFAREGADVAIAYLNEHRDAEETRKLIERQGRRCLTISGNVGNEGICRRIVSRVVREFG